MISIPTVETLLVIAGIGGWAGTWHATSVYFEDGPMMVDRVFKMAALPLIWGCTSIVMFVSGICLINSSMMIYASMFHPIPFVVNMIVLSIFFSAVSVIVSINKVFRSNAETVAAELAADAAANAASNTPDSDTEEDEATETSQATEETDSEEEESESEESDGAEEAEEADGGGGAEEAEGAEEADGAEETDGAEEAEGAEETDQGPAQVAEQTNAQDAPPPAQLSEPPHTVASIPLSPARSVSPVDAGEEITL